MQKKNLIRFMDSFVLLPLLTMSMPFNGFINNIVKTDINSYPQVVLAKKQNTEKDALVASNQAKEAAIQINDLKAKAIDAYFEDRNMPLKGVGKKMVEEAEKNDLDYRLLPAIAVRESTGGRHACIMVPNNPFGWGSCKIGFSSNDKAIETVARNLGGNNPNTDHHYANKTTKEILQKYNPPSIVPKYAEQVMGIMDVIGAAEITLNTNVVAINDSK
ncbi:MAG: hypothetical protein AAB510_00055 [Patescibacteria group bacterium]